MSTCKSFRQPRLFTSLAVLSLCACGVEADMSAPEPIASTTLAMDDPDGLMTPDFGSDFLPKEIKVLGAWFSEVSGYFAQAKSAFDMGIKFGQMINLIETPDPNAALHKVRDEIQTNIVAADLHNVMLFIDTQRGEAVWALQRVARAGSVAEGGNEDQSSGGAVSAITGPSESAFLRPYVEMGGGKDLVTKGRWTETISDRPPRSNTNLVYDWRLGVPAMLELISIRLAVIGGMDPNFRWNDRYDAELREIRSAVQHHYDKILGGIRCVEWWAQTDGVHRPLGQSMVCADIHTGIYARDSLSENWVSPTGIPGPSVSSVIMQRLRSQILRALPLFELRQMIDTLTLYINNGAQDLTETNQELRLATGASNFCIDIPWGDPSPLVPLQIYPCHGAAPQTWVYDRPTGQIRNPAVGTCLDVWPSSEKHPEQFVGNNGFANAATAYSNPCDGSHSQKWTHDPDTQQLQNGFGMFLYVNSWSPHEHDPVQAFQIASDGKATDANGVTVGFPKWQAVQKTIGKRSGLLWRHASGELKLWDTLSGLRYTEHSLGLVDTAWRTVASGDFNADGHGDIFWRHPDGSLSIWEMNGTSPVTSYASWNAPESKFAPFSGDVDGDGASDLVWPSVIDPRRPTHVATTWFMNPGSIEPRSTSVASSTVSKLVAVGNFDGDAYGRADELWQGFDGLITVELSGGGIPTFWMEPKTWVAKGVGDFNGDGTSEVLWYNPSEGRVARGLMLGGAQGTLAELGTVPPTDGWTIQGVADMDHDGISDIVWRHVEGAVSTWILNADASVREYPTLWLPTDVTFAGVIELGAPR